MDEDTTWDCIVIGGGAAGLSAALVLGRARRRTLVFDAGGQSNLAADHMGGLLGQDQRPAAAFYADGRAELAAYPSVEIRDAAVTAVARAEAGFRVDAAGATASAARLVLATGADYRYPSVSGIAERFGSSVFHCPFCHGWEVRDGQLAVLDPGPMGAARALLLSAWSNDVTLLTNGPAELGGEQLAQLRAAGITVDERPVARVEGPGRALDCVQFDTGERRACSGLLVPVTLDQRGGLADALGAERSAEGHFAGQVLQVDPTGQTTVPGVWAIGDAATSGPSVAAAIESGGRAAAAIVHQITAAAGRQPVPAA